MPKVDHTDLELEGQIALAQRTLERLFPAASVSTQVVDGVVKVTVLLDDDAMEDASTEQGLERLVDAMGARRGQR